MGARAINVNLPNGPMARTANAGNTTRNTINNATGGSKTWRQGNDTTDCLADERDGDTGKDNSQ